jgi:RND family efflux transporter MFP subunit
MLKKFLLPTGLVIGGIGLAAAIIATGPTLEQLPPPPNEPVVRTWEAHTETVRMSSFTHGSVVPRTESELIPEVSGRVINISKALNSGGFFSKGDMLLEIDSLDYEVALEQARAAVASAESEFANARKAHERQLDLASKQSTSESQRDDALNRMQFAQASLREAHARVSKAQRDLERTRLVAPFQGRVRSERVDIGQFVSRGTPVASLYSTDFAEVRLPLNDEELAFLELPLGGVSDPDAALPTAILRARFGGRDHQWESTIVRTEGELDPQTRMVNVIAQVEAPYDTEGDRPPLAIGLFVEAEIIGRTRHDIFVLPRSAMQANKQIYIIDEDNKLQFRNVDILRAVGEDLYIVDGLAPGETVSLSTVSNAIEGMAVRPLANNDIAMP